MNPFASGVDGEWANACLTKPLANSARLCYMCICHGDTQLCKRGSVARIAKAGPAGRWEPEVSVTVVLPTYNERENLATLVTAVLAELPDARVLVVDDNSPDGTGQLADSLARTDPPHVSVLHRPKKEGLGAAYVAGYLRALREWPDTEFLIQMDADFSHDPGYLRPMVEAMQDADVVVGSRYVNGISIVNWPLHRLIVSKLGTAYARLLTGLPITDCTSGFKCYRAEVLQAIDLGSIRSNGYVFQVETSFRAWRKGYRLNDLPIIFHERRAGESKLHLNIALEALWVVMRLGVARALERKPEVTREQSVPTAQAPEDPASSSP